MGTEKKGTTGTVGTPNARARERFLSHLVKMGNVSAAADFASIGRTTAYRWREKDEDFAAAWDDAQEQVTDRLEAAAILRATDGIEEVIGLTKEGKPIRATRRSDRLLEFLLRSRRRSVYGDKHEVTGKDGAPLLTKPLTEMTDAELKALVEVVTSR